MTIIEVDKIHNNQDDMSAMITMLRKNGIEAHSEKGLLIIPMDEPDTAVNILVNEGVMLHAVSYCYNKESNSHEA